MGQEKPPFAVDGVLHHLIVYAGVDGGNAYLVLEQKDPGSPDADVIYVEEASIPQLEDAIARVKAEIRAVNGTHAPWFKEGESLVLSTGTEVYSVMGVFGIGPDGCAHYGFDGDVGDFGPDLTPEEKQEMAETQIALWREWAKERTCEPEQT